MKIISGMWPLQLVSWHGKVRSLQNERLPPWLSSELRKTDCQPHIPAQGMGSFPFHGKLWFLLQFLAKKGENCPSECHSEGAGEEPEQHPAHWGVLVSCLWVGDDAVFPASQIPLGHSASPCGVQKEPELIFPEDLFFSMHHKLRGPGMQKRFSHQLCFCIGTVTLK